MAEPAPPLAPPPAGKARVCPRRRLSRWLGPAALVLLALVVAGNVYVLTATRARVLASVDVAPPRPVAIVLGNRVMPDGHPADALAERLGVGLALWQAGRVRRLIVSGLVRADGYDEPKAMAAWLVRRGVPADAITLDPTGHRTAATMAAAAAMGVREALVCSQAYHLPRALYLARHAGIDALGVPAREGASDNPEMRFRIFLRESLARAETVIEAAIR